MITNEELAEAGEALSEVLQSQGQMIITAESCTGGWIAKSLTDKAGSSAYVHGGLVTYSNDMKKTLLGVSQQSLDEHGAVSEPVVREMVAGALKLTGASIAVSVSGIAGPAGGTREKPVGTVWFAWGRTPDDTRAVRQVFSGDRDAVRRQAVMFALEGIRRFLIE